MPTEIQSCNTYVFLLDISSTPSDWSMEDSASNSIDQRLILHTVNSKGFFNLNLGLFGE